MHRVDDMVYFWSGRGSHGYVTVRELRGDHVLLDPEPEAKRGSDYRFLSAGRNYWAPRDRGVLHGQIDTVPRFWYSNF